MSAKAIAFQDELSRARVVAAERRKALEEAPELTAEQILDGFKRELRSVSVDGFGKVYYYPMTMAEKFDFKSKFRQESDGISATVENCARTVVALTRNSDGNTKFNESDVQTFVNASAEHFLQSVLPLANALIGAVSIESAEKK